MQIRAIIIILTRLAVNVDREQMAGARFGNPSDKRTHNTTTCVEILHRWTTRVALLLPIFLFLASALSGPSEARIAPRPAAADDLGFQFVRIQYESIGGWGRQPWAYDYPRAERHLYEAIERTTGIYLDGPPIVLTLKDEQIFEHPILYLCEPGYWKTDEEEVQNLQRYFERGGFMIIDDFHDGGRGSVGREWNNFYSIIKRVFPDREPVELTADHPIWSVYYDIDPVEAASTKDYEGFNRYDDRYFAIYDDDGRMMVVICYNQDIGDGWEWPGRNFEQASTVSFQMAINFIIYALTH